LATFWLHWLHTRLHSKSEIEATIAEWYSPTRITADITNPAGWDGWWVVLDGEDVIGAGGGAFHPPDSSELYVLYVDSTRRNQGVGTLLLNAITEELLSQGAREQ
jgi:GNAT superfamily N-acetyltransferase